MSDPNCWWGEDDPVPFDAYVSIGLPPEDVEDSEASGEDIARWSGAILAVARSVFGRGGRVVAGYDPVVAPLLAVAALECGDPRSAELPDERVAAPLALVVSEQAVRELRGPEEDVADSGGLPILDALSAAMSLESHFGAQPDGRGRVPLQVIDAERRRLGFVLWPDARSSADIDALREAGPILRFPARPSDAPVSEWSDLDAVDADQYVLDHERAETAYPYAFVTHRAVEDFLGGFEPELVT